MDDQLLERLRTRQPEAQLELRAQLFGRVVAVCTRMIRDPALAEEAAEDIFMDFAFQHVDRVRDPSALAAYLRVMTVRRCLRLRERRARQDELGELADPGQDPSGPEESLVQSLDLDKRQRRLAECLGRLSEKARRALRLRFHLEQTQEAIGTALGFSKQYAGRLIHRSLAALRACLEEAP